MTLSAEELESSRASLSTCQQGLQSVFDKAGKMAKGHGKRSEIQLVSPHPRLPPRRFPETGSPRTGTSKSTARSKQDQSLERQNTRESCRNNSTVCFRGFRPNRKLLRIIEEQYVHGQAHRLATGVPELRVSPVFRIELDGIPNVPSPQMHQSRA